MPYFEKLFLTYRISWCFPLGSFHPDRSRPNTCTYHHPGSEWHCECINLRHRSSLSESHSSIVYLHEYREINIISYVSHTLGSVFSFEWKVSQGISFYVTPCKEIAFCLEEKFTMLKNWYGFKRLNFFFMRRTL